jgi:large subunit ribosomal protein L32e
MAKFLRRDAKRFSKFGKGKGKKAKWRNPTGRDNKMREKRKGYPAVVSIGYKKSSDSKREIIKISNIKDLESSTKGQILVLGRIGAKKRAQIAKKSVELKLEFENFNPKKFLKNFKNKEKSKKEDEKKEKNSTDKKGEDKK